MAAATVMEATAMADEPVDLRVFVEAAGAGLADAQGAIAGDRLPTTAMAVSEATLEARVALGTAKDGSVRVETVNREDLRSIGAAAGSLSTVLVNFVALTDTADDTPDGTAPPVDKDVAIVAVAERADVKRLAEVLGPLRYDATLVPERSAWLVTARDGRGRLVRELLIDDAGSREG
jgi:hypothetical protein